MLELLHTVHHFESFARNTKIPHVDFGIAAPEIHRDLVMAQVSVVFWREIGQDQTCPKWTKLFNLCKFNLLVTICRLLLTDDKRGQMCN